MEKPNVRFHDGQILSEEPLNKAMEAVDYAVEEAQKVPEAVNAASSAAESAEHAASSAAAIEAALEAIKGSGDIPAATVAQVVENTAGISQLAKKTNGLYDNFNQRDFLENAERYKYINNEGIIAAAGTDSYRLVKFYVSSSQDFKFRLVTSFPRIAKFTDSTYSVSDGIIKEGQQLNVVETITLTEGYYAACSRDAGDYFKNIPSLTNKIEHISEIDNQVKEINSNIGSLKINVFALKDNDFNFGTYYDASGNEMNNQYRSVTDHIPVKEGDEFVYSLRNTSSALAIVCFKNSALSINDSVIISGYVSNQRFIVPSGVTEIMAVTQKVGDNIYIKKIGSIEDRIKYLESGDNVEEKTIWEASDFSINGYYDASTNTFNESQNRCITGFIPVKEGDVFKYQIGNTSSVYKIIEFNNGRFVRGIADDQNTGVYVVPANVDSIRFCGMTSDAQKPYLCVGKSNFRHKSNKITSCDKIIGFDKFIYDGNWSVNNGVAESHSNAAIKSNKPTFEDEFYLSATFNMTPAESNVWRLMFGKVGGSNDPNVGGATSSTLFSVYHSDTETYLQPYHVTKTADPITMSGKDKYPITGLDLNGVFYIRIEKHTADEVYFDVIITDRFGNTFAQKHIKQTKDLGSGVQDYIGVAWGAIYINAPISSGIKVSNLRFGYPTKDADLLIMGHSLVEGNASPTERDKRYASLIKNESNLKTLIFGKGGDQMEWALDVYPQYADWFAATQSLVNLGYNDGIQNGGINVTRFVKNAIKLNTMLENHGIEVTYLGHPPYVTNYASKTFNVNAGKDVDDVMKNLYKCIDICSAFLNSDGTVNTAMYNQSDLIHLSELGNQKVFNMIKAQAPYLFG